MARYTHITGMNDVLFEDQRYWRHILDRVRHVTDLYGYRRIDVPIMEVTSLFVRGVGEGTDIVEKEMYSFEDRDGAQISLRPEFTAGIMRAYIEDGLHVLPAPLKIWTTGPIFRHEKPQAGRYRQHSQFDIEVIGRWTRRWTSRSSMWPGACSATWASAASAWRSTRPAARPASRLTCKN